MLLVSFCGKRLWYSKINSQTFSEYSEKGVEKEVIKQAETGDKGDICKCLFFFFGIDVYYRRFLQISDISKWKIIKHKKMYKDELYCTNKSILYGESKFIYFHIYDWVNARNFCFREICIMKKVKFENCMKHNVNCQPQPRRKSAKIQL